MMSNNRVYVQGNYVDIHDNEVVNLNIDKAHVTVGATPKSNDLAEDAKILPADGEERPETAAEIMDDDIDGQDGREVPDFEAPTFNLKKMLWQPWFEGLRTDERYDAAWTDAFVEELMASEHGEKIARDWYNEGKLDKCTQIKGYVVGLLRDNEVLKGSKDAIAKRVNLMDNPRSFSKYMGKGCVQEYAQWVREYVKEH